MAYDQVREKIVMVGGLSSTAAIGRETWEWDGVDWVLRTTSGPAERARAMLAYDAAGARLILAEGISGSTAVADIWSWNGTSWTMVAPNDPQVQAQGRVLFDVARNRLVLGTATHLRGLDGTPWQRVPQGGLTLGELRVDSVAVHDDGAGPRPYAGGVFGRASGLSANGLARLEGNMWMPAGALPRSFGHVFKVGPGPSEGLWAWGHFEGDYNICRWNVADWAPLIVANQQIDGDESFFAADLGEGERLCAVGLLREGSVPSGPALQVFDGTRWSTVGYQEPPARTRGAMAHDPVRRRSVMFGGTSDGSGSGALNDTLEFNGRVWIARAIAGPGARFGHAMDFDQARGVTVLVGGRLASGQAHGETWTYDGSSWTMAAASIGGAVREGHAIAYDSARQKLVLFGGRNASGVVQGDTWEWDGTSWSQVATIGPPARANHAMAYDPVRGRIVMGAGVGATGSLISDTWSFDGASWTRLNGNLGGSKVSLLFDKVNQRVTAYPPGTDSVSLNASDQWISDTNGAFGLPEATARAATYDTSLNTPVFFGGTLTGEPLVASAHTRIRRQYLETPAVPVGQVRGAVRYGAGAQARLYLAASLGDRPSGGLSAYGDACDAPAIVTQPTGVAAVYNTSVSFTTNAVGTPPLAYQWRRNGVPVVNQPGMIFGAQSGTLSFNSTWSYGNAGTYDCLVTSPVGEAATNPVQFTVQNVGPSGPVLLTKILYPPEPVTGDPGLTLTTLSPAQLSDNTRAAFRTEFVSQSPGDGPAIALWENGATSLLARYFRTPPGVEPTVTVNQPDLCDMNPVTGDVVYRATLQGPMAPGYNQGIWHRNEVDQVQIARFGLEAAGTDGVYGTRAFAPVANALGQVAYIGSLVGGSTQPESSLGVWIWDRALGQRLVVRTGDVAPGTGLPFTNIHEATLADDGTLAIRASSGGVDGIWQGAPGTLAHRAGVGQPAPGFPAGTTLLSILPMGDSPGGRVYFAARVQNSPVIEGLYVSTGSGLTLIAKTGQQLPGRPSGETFGRFTALTSNGAGQFIFVATLACTTCGNASGLFLSQPSGAIVPIFYGGGLPPAGVSSYFTSANVGTLAAINDAGHLVFSGTVSAGAVNGPAIFGWTQSSGPFAIAAPGHQFEVMPGVYRTVSGPTIVGPNPSATDAGRSRALNAFGKVALRVSFSNSTSGLFLGTFGQFLTATFPCPTIATPVADVTARFGRTIVLEGEGAGTPPLVYRWYRDGQPLTDGGRIEGALTQRLTIRDLALGDAGTFSLRVGNACTESAVSSATVRVLCPADHDNGSSTGVPDDAVTIDDLLYFLIEFEQGLIGADIDDGSGIGRPDDAVTIDDLLSFVTRFEMGC